MLYNILSYSFKRVRFLFILLSAFALLNSKNLFAQENNQDSIFLSKSTDESFLIKLPEIDVLVDSAIKNSPRIKVLKLELEKSNIDVNLNKKKWLSAFSVNGGYNYGNNVRNLDGSIGAIYSSEAVNSYGTGISVSVNLYDALAYRGNVKKNILQSYIAVQELIDLEVQIRKEIIYQYHQIDLNAKILSIRIEYLNSCKVNLTSAEVNLKNNQISINQYSSVNEAFIKSKVDFELAKTTYLLSLISLEEKTRLNIR